MSNEPTDGIASVSGTSSAPSRLAMGASVRDLYPSRKDGQGRILARHDPVVADSKIAGPLSPPQLLHYQHHGLLQLDDVFNPAQITRVARATSDLLSSEFVLSHSAAVRQESGVVSAIIRPQAFSPIIEEVVEDARLQAIARQILGTEVYVHQSRVDHKPAFTGDETFWRSDFEAWHVDAGMPRMRALTIWVCITRLDDFTGPLMFIPGSHRQFVTCRRTQSGRQHPGTPSLELLSQLAHQNGISSPKPRPGAIVVFDCNLLYASGRNISPFPHCGLSIAYNSVENAPAAPYDSR